MGYERTKVKVVDQLGERRSESAYIGAQFVPFGFKFVDPDSVSERRD